MLCCWWRCWCNCCCWCLCCCCVQQAPGLPPKVAFRKNPPPISRGENSPRAYVSRIFLKARALNEFLSWAHIRFFSRNRSPGWGRGDHHTSCGEWRGVRGHSLRRRAATPILRIRKQCCTKTSFRGPADTHVYMFIKSVEYMHVCIYVSIACSCWWCCCCG